MPHFSLFEGKNNKFVTLDGLTNSVCQNVGEFLKPLLLMVDVVILKTYILKFGLICMWCQVTDQS